MPQVECVSKVVESMHEEQLPPKILIGSSVDQVVEPNDKSAKSELHLKDEAMSRVSSMTSSGIRSNAAVKLPIATQSHLSTRE